jgi:hypothetical protein
MKQLQTFNIISIHKKRTKKKVISVEQHKKAREKFGQKCMHE